MYILQQTLFSFEELLKIEYGERLPIFFSALDLTPYVKELTSKSPQGAKGYNRHAILRALLVAPLEGISTFTSLKKRLDSDIVFRYQCGFNAIQDVPSISTFSRIFKKITQKKLAEKLFHDLVEERRKEGIINGTKIAIDSTAINAYEKKQPKSKCKDSNNATWGAKFDSFKNKITWLGYKLHLAVDTESELPVALEVTPAHVNDGDMGPVLIDKVNSQASLKQINFIMMDAGYDQKKEL